jgi:hypothetical protein
VDFCPILTCVLLCIEVHQKVGGRAGASLLAVLDCGISLLSKTSNGPSRINPTVSSISPEYPVALPLCLCLSPAV